MRGRRGINPPGPVGGVGAGNPPVRSAEWVADRTLRVRSAEWVADRTLRVRSAESGRRNGVGLLR